MNQRIRAKCDNEDCLAFNTPKIAALGARCESCGRVLATISKVVGPLKGPSGKPPVRYKEGRKRSPKTC